MSRDELREVWAAAQALGGVHGGFVGMLLLTLQRRDEVAGAHWGEMSRDLTVWTIPSTRAKNHRDHIVHLSAPVQAILQSVPRRNQDGLVFGVVGGGKLTAFSFVKRRLDALIAAKRAQGTAEDPTSAMPCWRLHDFRRSGVTLLANCGVSPNVADKLLNHTTGTLSSVARVYQRAAFLDERRQALALFAEQVAGAA